MARKRLETTTAVVEDKREPYATIEGSGKCGYFVQVYANTGLYDSDEWYRHTLTLAGAERAAKRKLAKVKRILDHEKYSQRITIN